MFGLIKTNLRFTTLNKFTVIIGLILFGQSFLMADPGRYDSTLVGDYKYMLVAVCAAVLVKSERDKHSGFYCNMIASGYLRRQVFTAHLISCALYGGLLFLCTAIPLTAEMSAPFGFVTHAMVFMFCSMIVGCVSMLMNNIYGIVLVIFTIGIVYVSVDSLVLDPLYRIKYKYVYVEEPVETYIENGHIKLVDNRLYVDGVHRGFCKVLAYMNPISQMNYSQRAVKDLRGFDFDYYDDSMNEDYMLIGELFFPLTSLGMMAALTAGGYIFYRKKDLF